MAMVDEIVNEPVIHARDYLRDVSAAVRVSFNWMGTRKTLSTEQRARAAESFGAEQDYLSARKKILDTSHPAFKSVSSVRGRITAYWKAMSLPFPDPGIRLIRQAQVDSFNANLLSYQSELHDAVVELSRHFDELKSAARNRLGSLFTESDYPSSFEGLFGVSWDFPSVEPPQYLQRLNPRLYEQECQRVSNRFDQAVEMAEQAFTEELHRLVAHLAERLEGEVDGKPKVFRDSAIDNLQEFFTRFRKLNLRSDEQLDEVVSQCHQIVSNVAPNQLRNDSSIREAIAGELNQVQSVLDDLLVDRPRRNILRRAK